MKQSLDDGLRDLLNSYAEPCLGDCDHSQCPLLRELHALRIKSTLERARLTVKPTVDREREGERVTSDIMNMQLQSAAATAASVEQSDETELLRDTNILCRSGQGRPKS